MTKIFLPGQIKEDYRGDLFTIVSTNKRKQEEYDVFVYDIRDEEVVHLTGLWTILNNLERVYIGLNHKAGDLVAETLNGEAINPKLLKDMDKDIVCSHFIDNK